ncbi:UDP-N-acetylglucosamine 1-carboxyvinyltransferase [Candidatus Falkowbacteria bacterium RIFOXYB2_FULL_47_14]|uniref:UDP-N-acetylglucosamine 1-carboxyvinyltransferase n=1 Tax=Candidatus Falkowbacteria bacterium RIFOXYA2_FULL_47_19 TaxID=1797994 RepID=A0A1F5SKQ3_9BACT|nr:MAG: UDP-N-acetylglucosamine 1-carboxyvinyltransferase [Candidatus Falkowbacteria bacterium RIFOXYA2_FULL_47_19]OGF37008.1 MAG: UDP-N-acetylglucosamine 1-carboxyvinyltransferase [Candidatus Falkowbacteria bacterium RIFOXYC2_FULL_46_15]OGF44043.1 MAG: UDP-N-acetylglucosamine 1-carboxyvinyltransferase [Candidatus Falkowbacteria bacterium RIFOXYB2_FULL_47_14]
MSKLIINGGKRLTGEIEVKGAKNSALKIIPAALLSTESVKITNLPDIEDVGKALGLLESLGATIKRNGNEAVINTGSVNSSDLHSGPAGKFRASIMFAGPLLARFGEVKFPLPGGCVLASGAKRPIDLFLEGFERFGAKVTARENYYHIKARKLRGADYFFTTMTVTGTESLMMTAVLADGTTTLRNCAMEPEIPALASYLNSRGARIKGAGTPTITVEGVKSLTGGVYDVIPDRIETGSFAIMAAASKSEVLIKKCDPDHIRILLEIFDKIGVPYESFTDKLLVKPASKIRPYSIKTHEYPGFPTDLQSPFTLLMTQAQGSSLIHETIYDRRLLYVDMLMQMGADIIMCDPHRVVVNGPAKLYGKKLTSPDIRAGIAMIIAGLCAQGQTEIDNIYQIDRGYEDIDGRLRALGADINRII